MRLAGKGLALLVLSNALPGLTTPASAGTVCVFDEAAAPAYVEPRGHYAVVVSETTAARPDWRDAVAALRVKYDADVVTYPDGKPQAALPELRRLFPNYACFVATPEECGRAFVVAVHRLTRQLDEDPYGDVLWGIVTGYEATDALRMARLEQPLLIRRGATSMGPGCLGRLDAGFASNEAGPADFWTKAAGSSSIVHRTVSPDAARALAEAFNAQSPEVFYTSGHATERDWQIAYNLPGGAFKCDQGQLYAESTDGGRCPITSRNTKVYLPVGNCLIGHISGRDCMATAWMHSGGVAQMIGYTAVTFYGYMGWGTGQLFDDGRLSLSESFFLNNQALLQQLATRFPDLLGVMPESYGSRAAAALSARYAKGDADALGLLWDRDTVAFYGDPAWVARYAAGSPDVSCRLEEAGSVWTLRVNVLRDGSWGDPKWGARPVMALLPERVADIRDVACSPGGAPLVTDRFVLLPVSGTHNKGDKMTVSFKARRIIGNGKK